MSSLNTKFKVHYHEKEQVNGTKVTCRRLPCSDVYGP